MEIYVAQIEQTKWLVISSLLMILPSIYSFIYGLYFFTTLIILTSFISAFFWMKATCSWRRNIDLIFGKISFTIFVYTGICNANINTPFCIISGYSILCILLYCYYLSNKLSYQKNKNWIKYHFIFHLLIIYEMFITLYSIILNQKSLKI